MKSSVVEVYEEKNKDFFYNKQLGIIHNGETNLKPLVIENIIESSPTTLQCVETYGKFLGGSGFSNPELSEINLNEDEHKFKNLNDLLFEIRDYLKMHEEAFINVHYNANYEKVEFKVIPNSLCRLGKADSNDYSGKVLISEEGWGRYVKAKDLKIFDKYNPNPRAIEAQVEASGGWHLYKGQIMHFKFNNRFAYAKSPIETSYMFSDIETNLALYYNSTVKRGFEDVQLIKHRKFENPEDERAFKRNIKSISGIENASSKLLVEDDWDDETDKNGNIKVEQIKSNSEPDKFKHFEQSSSNMIRKTFQIPPQLIDFVAGKLGNTNGKDIKIAQSIYNTQTESKRKKISSLFKELFKNYVLDINPSGDWSIDQYKVLDDGTTNE